jgi:hypothetical protein
MVKRLIALTASAVCTLAVSASAAESENTTPPTPSAEVELAPRLLALGEAHTAKIDEARAKIEAAIEKIRATDNIEGVDKNELIAQLEAAAESLEANTPQLFELEGKALELKGLADAEKQGLLYKQMDPKAIEELKNQAQIWKDHALKFKQFAPGETPEVYRLEELKGLSELGQPLTPEQLEELKALPQKLQVFKVQGGEAGSFDLKRLRELEELRQYENGDAPSRVRVFTPQQLDELKQTYNVFTPEQIEELNALGKADASAAKGYSYVFESTPVDAQVRNLVASVLQGHQAFTEEQAAELRAQIEALVEQYLADKAEDTGNDESSNEDSED